VPGRRLGQHFLRDRAVLGTIVRALDPTQDDLVVEVGAGPGQLTAELVARAGAVVAIELDDGLAAALRATYAGNDRIAICHANALDIDPCRFVEHRRRYLLAGNIPYYISGALIRQYISGSCRPARAVLLVQLEVAERMTAKAGDMSLLGMAVQLYADATIVTRVPPSAFRPRPKVHSAVVKLEFLSSPRVALADEERFFRVARAGFSSKRKQIANSLSRGLELEKQDIIQVLSSVGVDATARPEDLDLDQWVAIVAGLDHLLERAQL
jgi:16S rRNA (adenine1518-N6/adenine1519-N6)-dimethyltransferase